MGEGRLVGLGTTVGAGVREGASVAVGSGERLRAGLGEAAWLTMTVGGGGVGRRNRAALSSEEISAALAALRPPMAVRMPGKVDQRALKASRALDWPWVGGGVSAYGGIQGWDADILLSWVCVGHSPKTTAVKA